MWALHTTPPAHPRSAGSVAASRTKTLLLLSVRSQSKTTASRLVFLSTVLIPLPPRSSLFNGVPAPVSSGLGDRCGTAQSRPSAVIAPCASRRRNVPAATTSFPSRRVVPTPYRACQQPLIFSLSSATNDWLGEIARWSCASCRKQRIREGARAHKRPSAIAVGPPAACCCRQPTGAASVTLRSQMRTECLMVMGASHACCA